MRILAVEHTVPQTRLTNNETIERMVGASKPYLTHDEIELARNHVSFILAMASAKTRHVTDGKEQPLDLVLEATEKALQVAGIPAKELDFIYFGGVSRRHLVPSCASVIQAAIGAEKSSCFDLSDACASWARALEVADRFLAGKSSGCGLVVSNETGFYEDCNPWEIASADKIKSQSSALTLGEAATAMVVGASDDDQFRFYSRTYGQFGGLAVLPIVEPGRYTELDLNTHDRLKFFTDTGELTKQGLKVSVKSVQEADFFSNGTADVFVPHAGAEASIDAFLKITNIPVADLVMTFRDYGNTVASSIPLGLSIGISDGRIKRGDRVFIATAAAGISTVGALFEY